MSSNKPVRPPDPEMNQLVELSLKIYLPLPFFRWLEEGAQIQHLPLNDWVQRWMRGAIAQAMMDESWVDVRAQIREQFPTEEAWIEFVCSLGTDKPE